MTIIRFLSLLLSLLLLLWSPFAQGEDQGEEKILPWIEMIIREDALLFDVRKELEKYISEQPERIQKVRIKTEELNQQLRKLIIIYNMEEGNPVELRDKLTQIEHLRRAGQDIIDPLNSEMESIDSFEKPLRENLTEYKQLSEEGVLREQKAILGKYINELKYMLDLAATARQLIAIVPNSVDALFIRLDNKKSEIEKDLIKSWKTFFLRPLPVYYFSAEGWKNAHKGMQAWVRFLPYWQIPLKESWSTFLNNLIMALAAGVIFIAGSLFFLGRAERRFPLAAPRRHLFPACLWLGVGLPLYIMITTCGLSQYGIYRFPAEALLAGGMVSLTWRMRRLSPTYEVSSKHNILWPLWCLFTAAIVAMTNHVPAALFSPFMAILLIVCALYLFCIRKGFQGNREKTFGAVSPVLLLVLSFISLSKWGNLSILIASIWFLLLLNIEFGSNIILVMERRKRANTGSLVAHNIVNGVVFPLLLIGSVTTTAVWICMCVGGMPLFNSLIQWRINFGLFNLTLAMAIIILAIFFIVRSVTALLHRALEFIIEQREEIHAGTIKSIQAILAYIFWTLYILFSLNLLGVKLEHIALIAGGLSIGVGFGIQDMIRNFISGLILLFGRSIHPGDEIETENVRGTVVRTSIRNTIVQTNEDSTIFIPNSDLAYKKVANWTYRDPKGRAEIVVGVAYGSDTDRVRTLLIESALAHPQVLREPPPYVLFFDFGENGLVFRLRFWIKNMIQQRDRVSSAIRFGIDTIFKEHKIEIAFPQRDIHIRSADGLNAFPDRQESLTRKEPVRSE
ncbi:MAG: mechanosensitive ion channel domain-containing protein [candidate division NC10 bacterium]